MILTGKAKTDFEKWNNDIYGIVDTAHSNECIEFNHLNPELQNTVIIDWFDSVGIFIETCCMYADEYFDYSILDSSNYTTHNEQCTSRHEATKQAIIKANEIYNNKT